MLRSKVKEERRQKWSWQRQVDKESVKIDFNREDELCRSQWSVDVNHIAAGLR